MGLTRVVSQSLSVTSMMQLQLSLTSTLKNLRESMMSMIDWRSFNYSRFTHVLSRQFKIRKLFLIVVNPILSTLQLQLDKIAAPPSLALSTMESFNVTVMSAPAQTFVVEQTASAM